VVDHLQALGIGPLEIIEADHHGAAPPPATVWPDQAQQQLEHAFGGQQPTLISREAADRGGLWPLGQLGGQTGLARARLANHKPA
jgi:hypothetical protein